MEALKAGAHGYALKGVGASELVNVVRTPVASGGSFVSPTLAARLLQAMRTPTSAGRRAAIRWPASRGARSRSSSSSRRV